MSVSKRIDLTDIAGVVVLYNPDDQFFENIKTYLHQVDKLYVVDNSDKPVINVSQYIGQISKIHYIKNEGNKGIAYALNVAIQAAITDGYSHLLTMDDDSKAPFDMIESMINFLHSTPFFSRIGILSVGHSKCHTEAAFKRVTYTMTSGNLLNLAACNKVGDFKEDFFIDHVDHEYNLRLKNSGYEVIELCRVKLEHNLGTLMSSNFGGKNIQYISHSPIRFFYFVRNGIYIIKNYCFSNPMDVFLISWLISKELLKSLLYENKRRIRIQYFFHAISTGWSGKLGKFINE